MTRRQASSPGERRRREGRAQAPRRIVRLTGAQPDIAWERLLFSAKESIYKAWFALTRTWLDFTGCELTVRSDDGTFTGRLLVPGHDAGGRMIERFDGRWTTHGRHILTVVREPAAGPQRTEAFAPRSTLSTRNRTDLGAEPDRSRRGTGPISTRNSTDLGEHGASPLRRRAERAHCTRWS